MNHSPMISVIMSVYNTPHEYLQASIESILNQTYCDFEFLIFDDASDKETKLILHSYNDSRMVIVTNPTNLGLTKNLNTGMRMARGKYIARMDADDVSYPKRFETMLEYFEKHEEENILGSYVLRENKVETQYASLSTNARRSLFLLSNAGPIHPSSMIRKSFFVEHDLWYNEHFKKSQDYDLWVRCMEYTDIRIVPEILLYYREHEGQISLKDRSEQDSYATEIKANLLIKSGINITLNEMERYIESRIRAQMDTRRFKSISRDIVYNNKRSRMYSGIWLRYVVEVYRLKYIKNNVSGVDALKEMIVEVFRIDFWCAIICYLVVEAHKCLDLLKVRRQIKDII